MWDEDDRNELKIAWDNFKNAPKQKQPLKFIYNAMLKLLDWLSKKLDK
jgi:hypothetical protein